MPSAVSIPSVAPPKVIGPATKRATRPASKLPQHLLDEAAGVKAVPFDPKKHLNFVPPARILTMKEIGLEGHGISPNAVAEPFSLLTEEAIRQIRAEVFSAPEERQYCSSFNRFMVRGMGAVRAPFTYAAFHSPELLEKISQVAGVDLVPAYDFEIANINISINDEPVATIQPEDGPLDDVSAVAWHYDSFPFVCVMMLSDCTGMIGGETAVRTPAGEVLKVRGPATGTATVLQGRYIEHQALKAVGGRERITLVTSWRPKSPFVKDETVLTGVRAISDVSEMYTQYTEYRLEILEERLRAKLKQERTRLSAGRAFDIAETRRFLGEQKEFIEAMLTEIIEIED